MKQEILLGLAGRQLLEAFDIKPEVCHLNEGHAAFAVLLRVGTLWGLYGNVCHVSWLFPRHHQKKLMPQS